MRAYEIALFIVLLSGAIGLVNGLGLFSDSYIATQQNPVMDSYNVSELGGATSITNDPGVLDYFTTLIGWAWQGLVLFVKVIFSIILLYPILEKDFGIPPLISGFIQLGIYVVYVVGLVQFLSGKSMKMME